MATSSLVEIFVPRKISPNEPLPIFRPILYLFPTRSSMFQSSMDQLLRRRRIVFSSKQVALPACDPFHGSHKSCTQDIGLKLQ
mmetsp:Transcript_22626/g.50973  ORF Transcript_22626/g.50973 Transcript_22626/m.50973 type:complete len:83 (-) Transcript_22626:36-284(-)